MCCIDQLKSSSMHEEYCHSRSEPSLAEMCDYRHFALCRQEIAQLTMQLKAANMNSKGGDKARQGLAKDLEKLQKKIADAETKARNLSDEKMQLTSEKAALERKAKVTETQISKLTKELEKKDGVCNRKINTIQEV